MESNITQTDDNPKTHVTFDLIMGVWLPGCICIFGIVGNSIALAVLSRDRHSVTLYSLRALAATDLVLLVAAMLQQVIPMWCIVTAQTHAFCLNQGYIRVYTWPVVCIAQMNSIWLTVLISAERFIAIVYPLKANRVCTMKNIRLAVLGITMAAITFNIPKFFEFTPERITEPSTNITKVIVGSTALRSDQVYRYFYNTALYCLVIYALPISILTRLNLTIVHKIKQAKKVWHSLNRTQKKEMNATILPLMIVLVFGISTTQSLVAFTLDAVFVKHFDSLWLQVYVAVVNLLVMLNSAINFILMCVFGKRFRTMLKETFRCKKKASTPKTSMNFV